MLWYEFVLKVKTINYIKLSGSETSYYWYNESNEILKVVVSEIEM